MIPSLHLSKNVAITLKEIEHTSSLLYLKREDLLHPVVSGNKFRKLKYNLQDAIANQKEAVLTFGGAYSNHIAAVAAAGKIVGLKTIGVIRGEELEGAYKNNETLTYAERCGMTFLFISRAQYKQKNSEKYLAEISAKFPNAYIIPEGGTNMLAVKGCEEILTPTDVDFNYICTAVGTGGTMAGLINASEDSQQVVGYSALKGTFQVSEVKKYTKKTNFTIKDRYSFGGYAKIDSELVRFMNSFKEQTGILLDPIYTAKMLFGIVTDMQNGVFPNSSRILAIHTGGLQGIKGMNQYLLKKNLPQIHT